MSVAEVVPLSPLPAPYPLPEGVGGWLDPAEGQKLAELATDKVVLEIGSFMGLSTICMARTAQKVHTVDWHKGDESTKLQAGEAWTLPALVMNVRRHKMEDKIVIHAGNADDILTKMLPHSFDMAFIDGAHDLESVCRDTNQALRLVKPGGLLVFHDYSTQPPVKAVADHLFPDGPLGTCESIAWYRKPEGPLLPPGPVVFVAAPGYGNYLPQTVRSLQSSVLADSKIQNWILRLEQGSLLAMTFNKLWCQALNTRQRDKLTHFAMHHSDIEAENGWLDKLLEEQQRTGADVLSVVVPIKDERGVTSTGLHTLKDSSTRRLTMKEIMELPETFDAEMAGAKEGECLAINTGLWICDFTKPWVEDVYFMIEDGIGRRDNGLFVPGTLSEDWFFSAQCAKKGLKVMATRKVKVAQDRKSVV